MTIEQIESLRIRHRLSKRELSLMLGYSRSYYGMIQEGKVELFDEFLKKAKGFFDYLEDTNCDIDSILNRIKEISNNDSFYTISKNTGISNSMLSNIRLKKTYPSLQLLDKISKTYNSTGFYLKYGKESPTLHKKEKSALIYENILNLMEEKGISQKEMYTKLGMSRITFWRIMNGKSELSVNTLFDIAKILDVSIIELALTYDEIKALLAESFKDIVD